MCGNSDWDSDRQAHIIICVAQCARMEDVLPEGLWLVCSKHQCLDSINGHTVCGLVQNQWWYSIWRRRLSNRPVDIGKWIAEWHVPSTQDFEWSMTALRASTNVWLFSLLGKAHSALIPWWKDCSVMVVGFKICLPCLILCCDAAWPSDSLWQLHISKIIQVLVEIESWVKDSEMYCYLFPMYLRCWCLLAVKMEVTIYRCFKSSHMCAVLMLHSKTDEQRLRRLLLYFFFFSLFKENMSVCLGEIVIRLSSNETLGKGKGKNEVKETKSSLKDQQYAVIWASILGNHELLTMIQK